MSDTEHELLVEAAAAIGAIAKRAPSPETFIDTLVSMLQFAQLPKPSTN
jgi:hypothetical protein